MIIVLFIILVFVIMFYLYKKHKKSESFNADDTNITLLYDDNPLPHVNPPPIKLHAFSNIPNAAPEPDNFHNEGTFNNNKPVSNNPSDNIPISTPANKYYPSSYPFNNDTSPFNMRLNPSNPNHQIKYN